MTTYTKEPTSDDLGRIADAHFNGSAEGVKLLDVYQINACNHVLMGTIDISGIEHGFIIESGDRNGTVIKGWGDPEDVGYFKHPEPPEPLTFVPRNPNLQIERPEMFRVYLAWREEPWFKEKEQSYNYDRHFQPGAVTENHYRSWAESKGMEVGLLSDLGDLSFFGVRS